LVKRLKGWIAFWVLVASFAATLAIARVGALVPRRRGRRRVLLVTGTFYNYNWFLSHARPLGLSGMDDVIFVSDEPLDAPDGVRFSCPPRWMCRMCGRAGSKLIWMCWLGWTIRPETCMGYHLFPGAMTALLAGRLSGARTCYQMTGGPVEILGGGFSNENVLMSSLNGSSAILERLAMAVARRFDLVVVRGSKAKAFLVERGVVDTRIRLITGSTEMVPPRPLSERPIDLVFLGRLAAFKQPEQFVAIVATVCEQIPGVRGVLIGDGPERATLEHEATRLGLSDQITFMGRITDVNSVLRTGKILVLTSRSEGMSIAMAEAMGCGLPAIAADVGELGELIDNGVNGWLIEPDNIQQYADRAIELLADPSKWESFSRAAVESSRSLTDVSSVASRWRDCLNPSAAELRTDPTKGDVGERCRI
jgi:L-malate glycosyltransferase